MKQSHFFTIEYNGKTISTAYNIQPYAYKAGYILVTYWDEEEQTTKSVKIKDRPIIIR